ncbi:hypothetical protein [Gynuella sp.]|uniref:hypothetical protein n=1 Tax=Gynuella sp. TaxID=2969146 RepID=UPI003D10C2B1
MKSFTHLMNELAVNKLLQQELSEIETEPEAYHHFFKIKGYECSLADVESVFKDIVWFARIGDDIDHA